MIKSIGYLSLIILIVAVVGLLLISYTTAIYFLIGVLLVRPIGYSLSWIFKPEQKWLVNTVGILILVFLIILVSQLSVSNYGPFRICNPGSVEMQVMINDYQALIEPIDPSKGLFEITEEVIYDIKRYVCEEDSSTSISIIAENFVVILPAREMRSSNRGIFIREIIITPLENSFLSAVTCCPKSPIVELHDFPRNSFYEAKDAQNLQISPYLDTETIIWSGFSLRRDIVFAYIAPPFYSVRDILALFIGVSYQSYSLIIIFSLLVTTVFSFLIKPVLSDIGKNKIKTFLDRKSQKPVKKTTIIVSSKGEEREVDVTEDS